MFLATSISVSGLHGFLILVAFILFLVAGFVAWFIAPRMIWASLVAAGLALYMFALLVSG
jgi:hypothetical protein